MIIVNYDFENDPENLSIGIDKNGEKEYDDIIDSWHECPNKCKGIELIRK